MNPFTLSQIPMSVLKRKLKQVSSGMGIAALFLMAGMAAGGPVEIPGKVRADTIVCAPETTAPNKPVNPKDWRHRSTFSRGAEDPMAQRMPNRRARARKDKTPGTGAMPSRRIPAR